jgi:hypothetical protein
MAQGKEGGGAGLHGLLWAPLSLFLPDVSHGRS